MMAPPPEVLAALAPVTRKPRREIVGGSTLFLIFVILVLFS